MIPFPDSAAVRNTPARRRRFGAPKNWRETFLACLAETSNVTAAAQCADISLSWVYKTKREDRDFAAAWLIALCEGYDNLELELLCRLRHGEARDVPAVKYDNATALRLLLAHRDAKARYQAQQENVSAEEVRASIDAKLVRLREQVQAHEAADAEAMKVAADIIGTCANVA
ncbi:MAG: hypothetical protein V4579_09390 [Pseudomonadota bacterium]